MARANVVRVPLAYISSSVPRGVCAVGGIEALANARPLWALVCLCALRCCRNERGAILFSAGPLTFLGRALHALCSGTLSVAGGSFHSHAGVGTSTQQGLSGPVPDWSVRCESATLAWRRAPVPTCCPRARWWCGRLRVRLAAGRSVCAF